MNEKGKNQSILFVMPRLPFPAVSGRKTSLYHYCRIISEELGFKLVVAAFLEKDDDQNLKPDFIDELVILRKPSKSEKLKNLLINSLIKKKYPFQVSLYLGHEAMNQVADLIDRVHPYAVIADMVRCTEYIKNVKSFKIADLDDRISLRYRRQLEADPQDTNPYGAFLETLPKIIKKMLLFRPLKAAVLKSEIDLLSKYEVSLNRSFDKVVFVAQKEADDYNTECHDKKALAIPIGVDTDYFCPLPDVKKENVIIFLGAMNVAHNENAVNYFIKDIFSYVLQKDASAVFYVVGGGVSEKLKALSSDNIRFLGRVEDVRNYLAAGRVFVCPMKFGSGIKTKILEAMAMGLPVVTTSIGAENINAEDGVDWIVEDSPEAFAAAVVNILQDTSLQKKYSQNARNFIQNKYTWDAAKKKLYELLVG